MVVKKNLVMMHFGRLASSSNRKVLLYLCYGLFLIFKVIVIK